MRTISWAVILLLTGLVGPAFADARCVQQGLSDLGFDPGPVDGVIGRRTTEAVALFAVNSGLGGPALSNETADEWCKTIGAFAKLPDAKDISHLDLILEPQGILSDSKQSKLWNAYATSSQCLEDQIYHLAPTHPVSVRMQTADAFGATAWQSPFPPLPGDEPRVCRARVATPTIPAAIPVVNLNEAYGERQDNVEEAAVWFSRNAAAYRFFGDAKYARMIRQGLMEWAQADSLGEGINVSWGTQPIDYQMMATILSLLSAASTVASEITADERATIGPWLNELVRNVGDSEWGQRQDNKQYMRNYTLLLWGLMTRDDSLIQNAIFEYKLAIHDMRPDGSWPVDSQRGGMGLHYGSNATSQLVLTALALKNSRGIDLFSYEVEGRSVHNAVDWIVSSIKSPGEVNSIYAIPCPDSGDRFGSIERPSMYYAEAGGYLLAYAQAFPDRESSKFIADYYSWQGAIEQDANGGIPACYFARPS